MKFTECLPIFFGQYLTNTIGVSEHTIKSYKDSFALLLIFASQYQSCKINSLEVEHLSSELILDFLDYLEADRNNSARTRNLRLASFKSLAKMIRIIYPEYRKYADNLLYIPQKRMQKKLINYITQEDFFKILKTVNLKRKEGVRDYTILNLLYDSGARASEIATLNLNYFNSQEGSLNILGKGNRFRQMLLWPKTVELISCYISKYRMMPKLLYSHRIFINQRSEEFTRHGINRICKKYLKLALAVKKLEGLSPVHSFRHGCAMNMLASGASITDIKNRLGHDNIQSTMIYLRLELKNKREVHKKFIEYTQSILKDNAKIEELIDWEKKDEILNWLDSL
jgi:integrase/recombinase XerD